MVTVVGYKQHASETGDFWFQQSADMIQQSADNTEDNLEKSAGKHGGLN